MTTQIDRKIHRDSSTANRNARSMHCLTAGSNTRCKQPAYVDIIEFVGTIAKVAMNFHNSLLRQYRSHFLFTQRLQHSGNALMRTGAPKENGRGFEESNIILIKESAQNFSVGKSTK